MKRLCLYVLMVAVLTGGLCSCGKNRDIIPRAKMSRIFADLFVSDAWLSMSSSEMKEKTDTMAFYEPIFRKYGFTTEDFLASTEYYLNDPARFSKIIAKSRHLLESEIEQLDGRKPLQDAEEIEMADVDGDELEDAKQDEGQEKTVRKQKGRRKKAEDVKEEPAL